MPIDAAVRKRGFRRWYERQLVESHAYLVTGILSVIMMSVALEAIAFRESAANALALVAIAAAGGALAIFAWNKFRGLMTIAEALAGQAVCTQCKTYARFEVLEARDSLEACTGRVLKVRCRKCEHCWTMG